ncbi:MAG TPA: class I SAM-dependent methyltransferase [Acidimicrobiales bacterium]|nr:class I SAM-dependent methyltransferase [Acidimicrobiales bacterium]
MTTTGLVPLPPRPPTSPRPERAPDAYLPMQQVTEQIAFLPDGWDAERRQKVRELFDGLAPEWHTRGGPDRVAPTVDALERGGVPAGGVALEIGSGTGLQTPPLAERFDYVVSVDLAAAMLALAERRTGVGLVRADASRLPVGPASADVVVCVNAFLFPDEYARVLRPGGRVVFVSTSGDQTPIYLAPEKVVAALAPALGGAHAVTSKCGHGSWTVVARAEHGAPDCPR